MSHRICEFCGGEFLPVRGALVCVSCGQYWRVRGGRQGSSAPKGRPVGPVAVRGQAADAGAARGLAQPLTPGSNNSKDGRSGVGEANS
jgi:hypothetical protein